MRKPIKTLIKRASPGIVGIEHLAEHWCHWEIMELYRQLGCWSRLIENDVLAGEYISVEYGLSYKEKMADHET